MKTFRIYLLLGAAFLLNLFPLPSLPDFVLLALLALHLPPAQGHRFPAAFFLGLLIDVAYSTPLGQRALVYIVLCYLTVLLRSSLCLMPLSSRLVYVYLAQLLASLLNFGLTLLHGKAVLSYHLGLAALVGTLLFVPLYLRVQRWLL